MQKRRATLRVWHHAPSKGTEVILVQEQQLACKGTCGSLVLSSNPVLEVTGGSNFITQVRFDISDGTELQPVCKVML